MTRLHDECIAYALASGLAPVFSSADQDAMIERSSRRSRWERRKAKHSNDRKGA